MKSYINQYKGKNIGWVSSETPLLSNLNILENIALIEESLYLVPTQKALSNAKETLLRAQCEESLLKRTATASQADIFCAQLCRASLLKSDKILIVTPFTQLHEREKIGYILDKIDRLDIENRCEILDIRSRKHQYEKGENLCLIEE